MRPGIRGEAAFPIPGVEDGDGEERNEVDQTVKITFTMEAAHLFEATSGLLLK